jgi:hypothetical protein
MRQLMVLAKKRNCGLTRCLFFWAVLVFGLVQWSFLPVLIQTDFQQGSPSLEAQNCHTAKFKAPFKHIFSDSSQAYVVTAQVSAPRAIEYFIRIPESPSAIIHAQSVTERQLRSPPSA